MGSRRGPRILSPVYMGELSTSYGLEIHVLTSYRCPGSRPQKGIVTYGLSPNRQNPFAGAAHDAIFNTWRRFSGQVLYWAPPMLVGYYLMSWATER